MDRAVELLDGWRRLAPADHWPLVRQAIIEQERGNAMQRSRAIDSALGLTRGPLRAAVAFLGAKLALRARVRKPAGEPSRNGEKEGNRERDREGERDRKDSVSVADPVPDATELSVAQRLFQECLREQPEHVEAQWCLAAVRSVLGDREALAAQAAEMDRPSVPDARFHFFGAVCCLAAREYRRVLRLGERASSIALARAEHGLGDHALAVESRFVMALAHLNLGEMDAAQEALRKVAGNDKSPSAVYARALLGQLSFQRGAHDEAVGWWSAVDAPSRARWGLDDPLRQTVLVAGLSALHEQRFEQAADRFREAGKLGLRDPRLGGLITLALSKAGQRLLYSQEE
jgi:tetratricopeptide (TPR) repeat protein